MSFQNLIPGTLIPSELYRNASGGPAVQATLRVAASQTIREGDLLIRTSGADTVEQALAAPTAGAATVQSAALVIVGMASTAIATNASGVDPEQDNANTIQVILWDPNNQFALPIVGVSGTTPTAAASEPRDVSVGTSYEILRFNTTGYGTGYGWNITTTTNAVARLNGLYQPTDNLSQYTLYWGTPRG